MAALATRPRRRRSPLVALGVAALAMVTAAACAPVKGQLGGHPRTMLVGDSIAHSVQGHLAFSFAARGRAFEPSAQLGCSVVRGVITDFQGGLLPSSNPCNEAMWGVHQAKVDTFRPDVVLWIDFFEGFPRHVGGTYFTPGPVTLPAPPGSVTGAPADDLLLALIEEKRAQFTAHGAVLVFVTVPPPPAGQDTSDQHRLRIPHLNNLLKRFVLEHPGTTALIDLAAMACPPAGESCPPSGLRTDGFHFSSDGATWAAERILAHL